MADPILYVPTRRMIKRIWGDGRVRSLEIKNAAEVSYWEDDFKGDQMRYDATAPGTYQSTASGTASATAAISTGVVNGAILLDAGTDDDGRSDLSLGLHYRGDLNATILWRASISAITSVKFEFGLTDVVSGTDAGAVNVKATPSFNATDCVVLAFDRDDDANLTLLGNANGTAATAIDFSTTLAAATYYYFGVTLRDGRAKGILLDANGNKIEETNWMESAVTSTVLLTPWAFVQNRSAAQRTATIDYLLVYQRRTTTS